MNGMIEQIKINGYQWKSFIEEKINEDIGSKRREWIDIGKRYYNNDNDVLYTTDETPQILENIRAKKVPHPYLQLVIDQKIGYFMDNGVEIMGNDSDIKIWNDNIDIKTFQRDLTDVLTETSISGDSWWFIYIDSNDLSFKWVEIPSEQIIPIYNNTFSKQLDAVIRYYNIYQNDNKITKVEFWDKDKVEFWEMTAEKELTLISEQRHILVMQDDLMLDQTSWGFPPFIHFKNNKNSTPDIKFIKELIDKIDDAESIENTEINSIKQKILKLKNYSGNTKNELIDLIDEINNIGAITVDGTGDAEWLTNSVDTNSYENSIKSTEKRLYTLSQSANFSTETIGNNTSGVALEFLFTPLDIKVKKFEKEVQESLDWFLYFFNKYLELMTSQKQIKIEFNFTYKRFTNKLEEAQIKQSEVLTANSLKGLVSEETRIEQYPFIQDVDLELQKLEEDTQKGLNGLFIDELQPQSEENQ